MAGRTTVDAPPIGCVLTLNEGTTLRSWSFRSPPPWRPRSVTVRTSTGTADSVALRGSAWEPTTTVSSEKPASRLCISAGDSPSASTSAGVIPRARPSSSTSVAPCSSGEPASCIAARPASAAAGASPPNAVAIRTVVNAADAHSRLMCKVPPPGFRWSV